MTHWLARLTVGPMTDTAYAKLTSPFLSHLRWKCVFKNFWRISGYHGLRIRPRKGGRLRKHRQQCKGRGSDVMPSPWNHRGGAGRSDEGVAPRPPRHWSRKAGRYVYQKEFPCARPSMAEGSALPICVCRLWGSHDSFAPRICIMGKLWPKCRRYSECSLPRNP